MRALSLVAIGAALSFKQVGSERLRQTFKQVSSERLRQGGHAIAQNATEHLRKIRQLSSHGVGSSACSEEHVALQTHVSMLERTVQDLISENKALSKIVEKARLSSVLQESKRFDSGAANKRVSPEASNSKGGTSWQTWAVLVLSVVAVLLFTIPGDKTKLMLSHDGSTREDGTPYVDVYACAAWFVEDAFQGHYSTEFLAKEGSCEERRALFQLWNIDKRYNRVASLFFVLWLFEPPTWCASNSFQFLWTLRDPTDVCRAPHGGGTVQLSGLPMLPQGASLVLEALLLAVLSMTLVQEHILGRQHPIGYKRSDRSFVTVLQIATVAAWFDLLHFVTIQQTTFRLRPWAGLLLTWAYPRVRHVMTDTITVVPELTKLLLLTSGSVILFAWLIQMVIDFLRDKNAEGYAGLGSTNFANGPQTIITLINIMAGNDFPDKMIPSFAKARWMGVIVVAFMALNYLLLMNLALAVVYQVFSKSQHQHLKTVRGNQFKSLMPAFYLLQEPLQRGAQGYAIFQKSFEGLIDALLESPRMRQFLDKEHAMLLFTTLDVDGSGSIDRKEFLDLCDDFMLNFSVAARDSWLMKASGWKFLERLQIWVESGKHDRVMTLIVCVNVIPIMVDSYFDMKNMTPPSWCTENLQILFAYIYLADVCLRLSVTSFGNYWNNGRNKFDFCASVGLLVATICYQRGIFDKSSLRFVNIARLLRIVLLLETVPQLAVMFACIRKILLVSKNVIVLLALVLFAFACAGIQIFGGLLHEGNPALAGSDYLAAGYDVVNFNDPIMAFLALFSNCVMGYSSNFSDAFGRVARWYFVGPLYCTTYLVVTIMMAFNIFVARLIDNYAALQHVEESHECELGRSQRFSGVQTLRDKLLEGGEVLHVSMTQEALELRTRSQVFDLSEGFEEDLADAITIVEAYQHVATARKRSSIDEAAAS